MLDISNTSNHLNVQRKKRKKEKRFASTIEYIVILECILFYAF